MLKNSMKNSNEFKIHILDTCQSGARKVTAEIQNCGSCKREISMNIREKSINVKIRNEQ